MIRALGNPCYLFLFKFNFPVLCFSIVIFFNLVLLVKLNSTLKS